MIATAILFPLDRIADANDAAGHDLREYATPPIGSKGCLQPWRHFVHPLARRQLPSNRELRFANAQHSATSMRESHAAHQNVRATVPGIGACFQFSHAVFPHFALEQRYLTPTAPADAAGHALTGDQRRLGNGIHRPTVCTLEPDRLDSTAILIRRHCQ